MLSLTLHSDGIPKSISCCVSLFPGQPWLCSRGEGFHGLPQAEWANTDPLPRAPLWSPDTTATNPSSNKWQKKVIPIDFVREWYWANDDNKLPKFHVTQWNWTKIINHQTNHFKHRTPFGLIFWNTWPAQKQDLRNNIYSIILFMHIN